MAEEQQNNVTPVELTSVQSEIANIVTPLIQELGKMVSKVLENYDQRLSAIEAQLKAVSTKESNNREVYHKIK